MKEIFKVFFYVPNLEIKEKVFKYCQSKEISFNYETVGLNLGGYHFKVWNITYEKKHKLWLFMREVCGPDFKFEAGISQGFVM